MSIDTDLEGLVLRPRLVPDSSEPIGLHADRAVAGVFVIKFVEGSHVRFTSAGLLVDADAIWAYDEEQRRLQRAHLDPVTAVDELARVQVVLEELRERGFEIHPMFRPSGHLYDPGDVETDWSFHEKSALEQSAGEELADLDLYYIAVAQGFGDMELQQELMNALNELPLIEQVYAAAPTDGATVPTPDLSMQQGYLGPAPAGVDARFAWTVAGGRGEGVQLVDVEYDWVTDHEDFPPASQLFWGGRPTCPYVAGGSEHGTAVLGIIAGPDNGSGITGLAPRVSYGLSSVCRPAEAFWHAHWAVFSGESWAGRTHNVITSHAIFYAAEALRPGDVLLVEQHTFGPLVGPCPAGADCSQWEYVPMEYFQEAFDVIRRITARGIIVVEAAGNGGQNLDMAIYQDRFNPTWRHSGALMVGASGAGDRRPNSSSNSSVRIDVHSWGAGIVTIGYGNGNTPPFDSGRPINRYYGPNFGGTSGASAIVAGAVACLQGARRASDQPPLSPSALDRLLKATGTPQDGTMAEQQARPIGPQPDLRLAIDQARAPSGEFSGAGVYTIRAKHSGKVLDIDIGWFRGQDDGQPLVQFEYHGGLNQQFEIIATGFGPYWIRPRHTRGKVLEVAGASTADEAPLQQWTQQPNVQHQLFLIEPIGGFYRIMATHSGKVLDVAALSQQNSARVQQWTWWGGDNQLWEFRPVDH